MRHTLRRRDLPWAVLGLAAVAAHASPAEVAGSFVQEFEGLKLLDQEGRSFSFRRLSGKLVLVNFVFTGCSSVCPLQTRALVETLGRLPPAAKDKVRLVSISIDPLSDTPPVLRKYAVSLGAELTRWSFVTGGPTDIQRISDRLRLFKVRGSITTPEDHATTLWLIDPQGRLIQRYPGSPLDVDRLTRELAYLSTAG